MQRKVAQFAGLSMEYFVAGQGKPVIAFHGFGRHAADFEVFREVLGNDEQLIAINLFQHGESRWPKKREFTDSLNRKELLGLLDAIPEIKNHAQFSLWGYSMGGRIALTLLEEVPERIARVMLIAPDGLKMAKMYRFAAHTRLGNSVYRMLMSRPHLITGTIDLAHKLRLVNSKFHRFIHVHLESKEKAQLVYEAWLIYRYFQPRLPHVADVLNSHPIRFTMIFGRYDSVIRPTFAVNLDALLDTPNTHFIDSGHLLMTVQTADFIVQHKLWTDA
ncbi:MAG: hypothetical protein RL226_628 [Bacteroidota bacterium]